MGKRCRAWGESKMRRGAGTAHESDLASRVAVRRLVPGVAYRTATAAARRTARQRRGTGALTRWLAFRTLLRRRLAADARGCRSDPWPPRTRSCPRRGRPAQCGYDQPVIG